MRFTISSNALYSVLQNNLKVIPTKATMPILDYFLFTVEDGLLTIVSSDLEITLTSKIELLSEDVPGAIAVPSRRIIDSLRELTDQPITFEVLENNVIKILWKTGKLMLPGVEADGFPIVSDIEDSIQSFDISADWLSAAINKTLFAASDNELRPIMSGVHFDLTPDAATFVATDAHKLVRLIKNSPNKDITEHCSFNLPKKPANLLKNLLLKQTSDIKVTFSSKNIMFVLDDYKLICRTIEGRYPNYNSVIPKNNVNKVLVDRVLLLNSLKRVSVCSNVVSNLIKFTICDNAIGLVAQDTDFSVSAEDSIECDYSGDMLTLGFKAPYVIDMLQNMSTEMVSLEFADATRAGLIVPYEPKDELEQNLLMLLMPIMS
ncbi:MAG: DNA polymerase III subunit beta [Rikenellaceae bacterium]